MRRSWIVFLLDDIKRPNTDGIPVGCVFGAEIEREAVLLGRRRHVEGLQEMDGAEIPVLVPEFPVRLVALGDKGPVVIVYYGINRVVEPLDFFYPRLGEHPLDPLPVGAFEVGDELGDLVVDHLVIAFQEGARGKGKRGKCRGDRASNASQFSSHIFHL